MPAACTGAKRYGGRFSIEMANSALKTLDRIKRIPFVTCRPSTVTFDGVSATENHFKTHCFDCRSHCVAFEPERQAIDSQINFNSFSVFHFHEFSFKFVTFRRVSSRLIVFNVGSIHSIAVGVLAHIWRATCDSILSSIHRRISTSETPCNWYRAPFNALIVRCVHRTGWFQYWKNQS